MTPRSRKAAPAFFIPDIQNTGYNRQKNWCLKVRIPDYLSLRASAHTGVAIPRLNETRYRLPPKIAANPNLLGSFRNISPLTGGLPRRFAPRNDSKNERFKQQFIVPDVLSAEGLENEHIRLYFMPIPNPG